MTRMIRKQVYIEADQDERLKKKAQELDVSEAELVRRGIEKVLAEPDGEAARIAAWEDAKEFIRQRMAMKVPQTDRGWTREDMYEERLDRISHRQ